MYAVVEIAGKQYKVQENDKLFVPHLADAKVDDTIEIDRVLLVADEDDVRVGTPLVDNATVEAKVVGHVKADKIFVFRKIRRKRFKVKKGHRQRYTQIEVGTLSLNGKGKKSSKAKAKPADESKATSKAAAKPDEPADAVAVEVPATEAATPKTTATETSKSDSAESPAAETTKSNSAESPAAEAAKSDVPAAEKPAKSKSQSKKSKEEAGATADAGEELRPEAEAGPDPASEDASDNSDDDKSGTAG